MSVHVYIAPQKSGFHFTVDVKDDEGEKVRKRVRFEKGQFRTEDDDFAAAIDATIAKYPTISRYCKKTDKEAAEELARKHRAMLSRTGATKGGVTAEAARTAMDRTLAERDEEFRRQLNNPDGAKEQLVNENLQMTDKIPSAPVEPPVAKPILNVGGAK